MATVKAFLKKNDDGEAEIRMFTVNFPAGQSAFSILVEKIATVFPNLRKEEVKLFYKGKLSLLC